MKKNERFIIYGGCYGLLLLAAFLLQLKWQGYFCCSIVFVFIMWRLDKVMKEESRQKIRLREAELYMEQMLYAFLQNPKILSALEIRDLFHWTRKNYIQGWRPYPGGSPRARGGDARGD